MRVKRIISRQMNRLVPSSSMGAQLANLNALKCVIITVLSWFFIFSVHLSQPVSTGFAFQLTFISRLRSPRRKDGG